MIANLTRIKTQKGMSKTFFGVIKKTKNSSQNNTCVKGHMQNLV